MEEAHLARHLRVDRAVEETEEAEEIPSCRTESTYQLHQGCPVEGAEEVEEAEVRRSHHPAPVQVQPRTGYRCILSQLQ